MTLIMTSGTVKETQRSHVCCVTETGAKYMHQKLTEPKGARSTFAILVAGFDIVLSVAAGSSLK